ncbi:MAG: NADH-quinone oxidoreductase subunit NuoK [Muribaculaceae bacterium]|nr:NADH-quinone oxidoreductase subunit NuoK [Muribaculaceae bacterium]MDE5968947.1 NADH-quinone oxidoreductase subunit NuoK [Muribaculaceae bacterium]MDE7394068.1 NADH-quinone oxidoreductase subunit NuoK [Muribaculaceae bacterium]
MNIELNALMFLIPSLFMFCCGIYGFITRRNMIAILISLELMLNSVDINFAVFNRFLFPGQLDGMFFSLFAIALAAAETAIAIAIIINAVRLSRDADVKDLSKMKF